MTFDNLPGEMKSCDNWLVWRLEERQGQAKPTKVPYSARGGAGKTNDSATWSSYADAIAAYNSGHYSGIGFVFTGTPFIGVDIDNCLDIITGELSPEADSIVKTLGSYTEWSQSGRGLHVIVRGSLPDGRRRNGNIEMYGNGSPRYFAMTGKLCGDCRTIRECQADIHAVHAQYIEPLGKPVPRPQGVSSPIADDILTKARRARNGRQFSALYDYGDISAYPSASEADQALCNMLSFWTACDPERMDSLFRQSALFRDKWDEKRGSDTYGNITIATAIRGCESTYNPQAHFKRRSEAYTLKTSDGFKSLTTLDPVSNDRYGWHDQGNGYLFADWYRDVARYVPERKKWYVYDGRVWQPDIGDLRVSELCKQLADALMIYALALDEGDKKQMYMDHVKKWQRRSYRETILKDAASVHWVSIDAFDTDPFSFNCLNGTLDLKTRAFREHRAEDMLSKISGVDYAPGMVSERWERFIQEVMQGDKDKAAFLQKAMGYALTGDTRRECFFVLYGPISRNGKGTTMETFMRLMGDYGKSARPDTIAQKHTANSNGPSEDIARLAGARFVNISEPDKKMVLSTALVKTLTGNDRITARYLNENSFEFLPQFKLFINTNHLPAVTDVTLFSSGRVKIIPFQRHFSEEERDEGLKTELSQPENLSGILNWCVEGLWLIEETGFDPPESVRMATEDYKQSSDRMGRFFEDEMIKMPGAETRTADIYQRYQEWCTANGYKYENNTNFKLALENIGPVARARPAGSGRDAQKSWLFYGYALKSKITYEFVPN